MGIWLCVVSVMSLLYELVGHGGVVSCFAVCEARKRIFSGGLNGRIRAWDFGMAQHVDEALVRHDSSISSLAVKADGKGLCV